MSELVTATVADGRVWLRTPFALKDAVKQLPGRRWDPDSKRWHVPASQESALNVRAALGNLPLRCDRPFLELLADAQRAERALDLRDAAELPPIPGEGDGRPPAWAHQRISFWMAVGRLGGGPPRELD